MSKSGVGIIGSLRMGEEENVTLEIPRDIPWQYSDYKLVYNGQCSGETPPHRSFGRGKRTTLGPIYALSEKELQVLQFEQKTICGFFNP